MMKYEQKKQGCAGSKKCAPNARKRIDCGFLKAPPGHDDGRLHRDGDGKQSGAGGKLQGNFGIYAGLHYASGQGMPDCHMRPVSPYCLLYE